MNDETTVLHGRVAVLERESRRLRRMLALAVTVALVFSVWNSRSNAQPSADSLRVRGLIVEDGNGRPRISLGAPLAGMGGTPRTGMRITDPRGFERFGVGLFDDGRLVMGIDGPPPSTGPAGNLERINLVADNDGAGYIAFKDRDSRVVGRIYLDPQNKLWVEFSDFAQQPPARRRIGLAGEETIPTPSEKGQ